MSSNDEELERKIDVLRKSFAAGLVGRLNELDAALATIANNIPLTNQVGAIRAILELSHKIAGSAGTFGFSRMSVIASTIEQLCDDILKNRHGADGEAHRALGDRIAALHAEMPK